VIYDSDVTEDVTGPVTGTASENVVEATPDFARRRLRVRLRRWRPLIVVALVVVLVVLAAYLLYFSSALAVSAVKVTGNSTVSASRIERIAQVPHGQQLVRVDLAAIQARVESIPAVKSAAVSRSWPHTIAITVTEREPVAVVERGTTFQSLDENGILFGRYAKAPPTLPLVKSPPNVTASALSEAAKVVAVLRPDIAARVDYVRVDTVDEISLEMADGLTVAWGSAEDSENKAEVLAVLLKKKDLKQIDVSVPGRPTTTAR
jgi:cell division protein FtsQ